ncbi:MAG: glycosyltransferase [Chthoniobacterales bacterium]
MNSMNPQVTILMPCLNEAETLEVCITKAWQGIRDAGVEGEVIIADNGSIDGSIEIAERLGARVVHVTEKGYGCALRGGIEASLAPWIIMADSDDSYDFSNIRGFVDQPFGLLAREICGEVGRRLRPRDGVSSSLRGGADHAGRHALEEPMDRKSLSLSARSRFVPHANS